MKQPNNQPNSSTRLSRRRWWRWGVASIKYFFLTLLIYLSTCLIGLIPVNNDFQNTLDGVSVIIISNAVHSELVLPIEAADWNWRNFFSATDFEAETDWATHVSIGWGDRGFFIQTPQWSDLTLSTAANALLWPSSTCVHVSMTIGDQELNYGVEVRLTEEQYQLLAKHVAASFDRDATGNLSRIPNSSYHQYDAFYSGAGSYHLFNTCNNWVGRSMRQAGIRVGWFTPLPKSVFFWLPNSEN